MAIKISGSVLVAGSTTINETEFGYLDGLTAGTVAASKAVVVDANKDISGYRHVTATGAVTAGTSFIIGSADLNEADMEKLDGITDGTVAANKAVVVDSNKDANGFRNIDGTGDLTMGSITMAEFTVDSSGNTDVDGTLNVEGVPTFQAQSVHSAGATFNSAGLAACGAIAGATSVDGSGDLTMGTITMSGFTVDADGDTALKSLLVDDDSTIGCDSDTDLLTLSDGALVVAGTLQCNTSLTIGSAAMSEADLEKLDGITNGTAAANKALVLGPQKQLGTITSLTASYAKIDVLDVNEINSVTKTETTLEVVDKLITVASGSNSSNSDGSGLKFGGTDADNVASIKYDHSNAAIDFNIAGTTEIRLANGVLRPETDNDIDLGASGAEFKDLYLDGVAYIDSLQADQLGAAMDCNSQAMTNVDINSGNIDGTVIGAASVAAGSFAALAAAAGTFSGVLKTDDTTEATSTTDGSLQTDGGLSVAKSAVVGDDLDLLSDAAILNFGADKDVNLTHVHNAGLLLNSSRQLQFGDSATHIKQVSDSNLEVEADGSLILDSPVVDFQDDGVVLKFGDDSEVTLTHVHNTGLNLVGALSGSSTLRLKGAATFGPGNGSFLVDSLGHVTSSGDCHFLQGSGGGGVSVDANGLTSAMAISGSSTLRVVGASTFGAGNGAAVIAADGGLTIDHFDANWTNASRTVADMGIVTTMDLNGGTADNVVIGASTPAAGTFTALVANGNVDLGDATSDTITATGRFDSDLVPSTDSARDLGTSALQWAELHVDAGYIDQLGAALDCNSQAMTNVDINSGNMDGTIIGNSSAALGKFTVVSASAGIELAGALASGYTIDCDANAGGIRADEFVTYSDRTLKTNIQKMDGALEKVMKLEAVTYDKKATGKSEIGFIAQDVAKVVPEVCALDANGEGRGIDYSRMSTLLVGALKAQQEQIAQLKEIVAKLQK